MSLLTRVMLLILTLVVGVAVAFVAVSIWTGGIWDIGSEDAVRLQAGLRSAETMRMRLAAGTGALAALILVLGLAATFARERSVTLWLGGRHAVRVPAAVVERYVRASLDGVKDIEDARVTAKPAGSHGTALLLDLKVTPDADAAAVTASAEARVDAMRTSSIAMLSDGRPNITIRHAARRRARSSHQVA